MICEVGAHFFELSSEDIQAYEKFGVEPLSICFSHQHQWRLAFRNDRFLHRRKCDLTGAEIISMYPQNVPFKVYEREAWFSDRYDPLRYGRPFDFSRPFFEQYAELQKQVPRMALVNIGSVNSDYCNSCVYNKDCYLIFGGDRNEECMYGSLPMNCKNCLDCDWTDKCELCYYCAYCKECYSCQFAFNSKNCSDCSFVENCVGCSECIMCFDLQNKKFHIDNQPYSKEEYFKKKEELMSGKFSDQQKLWQQFKEKRQNRIVKYAMIINSENCSGELIFNSKNCVHCFECTGTQDCREVYTGFNAQNCFNGDYLGLNTAWNFNNLSTDTAYNVMCSYFTVSSSDVAYSEAINYSKNVFGSIGLKHNEYVILNKVYAPDEYKKLRTQIVEQMKKTGDWGRFFPKNLSTFPYNESTASFFYPRTQQEAAGEGFAWREEETTATPQNYIIPDDISEVEDDILNEALACEQSGKNFRIIPQELAFYRQHKIPLPRRHPDQRYRDRLALRNAPTVFERSCEKCGVKLKSSYGPDRPETIYCEKCYLEALY